MGWDFKYYEYVLLGANRVVVIRADLPELLKKSKVESRVLDTMTSMVHRICTGNDGQHVVLPEKEILAAKDLPLWLGELSILRFKLMLGDYGAVQES